MHRYNKLYGYGDLLRDYCGGRPDQPIWGEVQHSLFMNIYHFRESGPLGPPREQLGRFPRLLSWQKILPFPHQLPIGIPLAYFLDKNREQFALPAGYESLRDTNYVLVMPRMDKDITIDKRIAKYRALVEEGLSNDPGRHLVFALHPKDGDNKDLLEKEFGQYGEFVWRGKTDPITDLKASFALVQNASEMWSNYFGAHVFQAAAFFRAPTKLFGEGLFKDNYHENMTRYLRAFYDATGDIDTQAEVGSQVLGLEYLRSADELRDILGFTGAKALLGKPVKAAYKILRRYKVKWRVLRGYQSPRGARIGLDD
jgi:hypothetical protein